MTASSAEQLRKEGNELFKCGDYEGALTAYTQALSLGATPQDQAILHRNRAACHLKLEDYSKAESEASKAIEKDGGDVKALYRRSQALEKLGRLDQAVLDLKRCVSLEPKNKVFQESLRNIGGQIQEKVRYMSSTDAKVEQMFQILLDPKEKGTEKKQKASQNLVVLAREDAGAEKIFRSNGVQLLQRLLDTGETDLMLAALRTLVGICSEHQSRVCGVERSSYCFRLCVCVSVCLLSSTCLRFHSSSCSKTSLKHRQIQSDTDTTRREK